VDVVVYIINFKGYKHGYEWIWMDSCGLSVLDIADASKCHKAFLWRSGPKHWEFVLKIAEGQKLHVN